METLRQTAMNVSVLNLTAGRGGGYITKQYPLSALDCSKTRPRPRPKSRPITAVYYKLQNRRRSLCVVLKASKSDRNKHSGVSLPEELYEYYPEAVLLKKEGKKESPLPDFADIDEEELLTSLELQMESTMDVKITRHYEIVYLIHEDYADEVQEVVSKVNGFIEERKGTIWRLNDWGMRRLAYKIKKARRANYILMNIEIPSEDINDLKDLLDKDERIIRHLTIKQKQAITEDCPPPPEYRPYTSLSDDEDMDETEDIDEADHEYQLEGELKELEELEEEEEDDNDDDDDDDDEDEDEDEDDDDDDEDEDEDVEDREEEEYEDELEKEEDLEKEVGFESAKQEDAKK